MPCLAEDLKFFDMGGEKEEGRWKTCAKEPDGWYGKVEIVR